MPTPVLIPLLNPNEPEALLAKLSVVEGQQVEIGDILCTLETTKTTADMQAEVGGFVAGLRLHQGQTVRAGDVLCFLAETPEWRPPPLETPSQGSDVSEAIPPGMRITKPALEKARRLGIRLDEFPVGRLITESDVQAIADKNTRSPRYDQDIPLVSTFDPTAIVVYGGGGHGKSLIELIRALGSYRIVGVVDDNLPKGLSLLGVPVLGGAQALPDLHRDGVRLAANAVGGIGNLSVRVEIFRRLAEAGFGCPALVHPRAFVEASAALAPGTQVFPQAYIGSEVEVGFGTIINTGAIVSHDCKLGSYVNLSPGAILAGGVQVGEGVLIGMGVTVNLLVRIGRGARIGNGATVKNDVPDGGLVRAGATWLDQEKREP